MKTMKKTALSAALISGLTNSLAYERGEIKLKTVKRQVCRWSRSFQKRR